jgi:hypothetical protein
MAIQQNTPKIGMNIEQLRAALSRDDLEYTWESDENGTYVRETHYRMMTCIVAPYMFMPSLKVFSTTKFYFCADTICCIVIEEPKEGSDFNSNLRGPDSP